MSGQLVVSAASTAGSVLAEIGKSVGKAIAKNPAGALVVVTILGVTYFTMNSKSSFKFEVQSGS